MSYDLMRTYGFDKGSEPDLDAWFESGYDDVDSAHRALKRIAAFLATYKTALHESPTIAGRELLHRLLPEHVRYPQLPDGVQSLLRHNFTQACVQHVPSVPAVWDIYQYDARFAYASCLKHVPVAMSGQVEHLPSGLFQDSQIEA